MQYEKKNAILQSPVQEVQSLTHEVCFEIHINHGYAKGRAYQDMVCLSSPHDLPFGFELDLTQIQVNQFQNLKVPLLK